MTPILGNGVYTIAEAHRLTGVSAAKIAGWLWGYSTRDSGGVRRSDPVLQPSYESVGGQRAVSFLDLMEIRLVDALRTWGFSLHKIRLAARLARVEISSHHPFATRTFRSDGRSILMNVFKNDGSEGTLDLLVSQLAFEEFLDPFLHAGVSFEGGDHPDAWRPHPDLRVIVDPQRSFGAPISMTGSIRTEVLAASYRAEGSYSRAAWVFEVPVGAVRDAVEFERRLAA